jgi:hypothetical protein
MIRSQFLEGRYAYIPNIPIPQFEMVGRYLYVSLQSVVAHIMAHGIPLLCLKKRTDDSDIVQYLSESYKASIVLDNALRIYPNYDIITFVTEWSDSFDANTSTKNNRGSVYVRSISFAKPDDSSWPISFYTYPICIGPSKGDKTVVESRFSDELENFKQNTPLQFLDGASKVMKSIYVDLLCSIKDQPERRSSMCMRMGNSRHTPRWGYCFDYRQKASTIVSCDHCFQSIKLYGSHISNCDKCVSWMITVDDNNADNAQFLKFDPPPGFPKTLYMLMPTICYRQLLSQIVF